jgi:hypothetical protein
LLSPVDAPRVSAGKTQLEPAEDLEPEASLAVIAVGSRHLFAGERDADPAEGFRAGLPGSTTIRRSGILQGFEMGVHFGSPIGGARYATSRGWAPRLAWKRDPKMCPVIAA